MTNSIIVTLFGHFLAPRIMVLTSRPYPLRPDNFIVSSKKLDFFTFVSECKKCEIFPGDRLPHFFKRIFIVGHSGLPPTFLLLKNMC